MATIETTSAKPEGVSTRHRWSPRRLALVAGFGALVTGGALALDGAARADDPPVHTRAFTSVAVGAVNGGADTIGLAGRTFAAVQLALADESRPASIQVPLSNVLGAELITLNDVSLVVDTDKHQVVLRGTSTDAFGLLGSATTEVLIIADWVDDIHDQPSFVVSARAGALTVGDVLGVAPGSSLVSTLGTTGPIVTVGYSSIDPDSDPDNTHISFSDNLSALAVDFYTQAYGPSGLPDQVPAIADIDDKTHITIPVGLDALGGLPRDVLGYGAGETVVFEGGLGMTLTQSKTFDPQTAGWSLSATMPPVGATLPGQLPDWLRLDPSVRLTATIAYGQEATVEEHVIDPDDASTLPPATPTASENVVLQLAAPVKFNLFGGEREVAIELQVQQSSTDPNERVITVDIETEDVWPNVLGLGFVDLGDLEIEAVFKRVPGTDGGAPTTSLDGLIGGKVRIAGKEFAAQLSGAFEPGDTDVSLMLLLDDSISIGEIVGALGGDVGGLPAALTGPSIGPLGIQITVGGGAGGGSTPDGSTPDGSTPGGATPGGSSPTVTITAVGQFELPLPSGGATLPVKAMFSFGSEADANGRRPVTVGVRTADDLRLSDILPPGIEMPFDLELVNEDEGSATGFVFSTSNVQMQLNDQPEFVRQFYRPLYGRAPDNPDALEIILPSGASVIGAFNLPADLAEVVGTIGYQSYVSVRGTLPIFEADQSVNLALGLAMKSSLLPDFVDQAVGELQVDVAFGAQPRLRMGLQGELRLRLPAGLPPEVADALNAAGIPMEAFADVPAGYQCQNGSSPQPVSGRAGVYRCYDRLALALNAGIEFEGAKINLETIGSLTTPIPGQLYHPFGVGWIGIDEARMRLAIASDSDVAIELGVMGDITVGRTDMLAAAQISVALLPQAPYVEVELQGIRAASGAGLDLGDLFDIHHEIAVLYARALGEPDPPSINPADVGLPNLALRNVELSFSPNGVPDLCIPAGFVIAGDFYVDPSGSEPRRDPTCSNGTSVIPEPRDRCFNRRNDGCIGGIRLAVSHAGIVGQLDLAGFDAGPVHLTNATMDLALTLADQRLSVIGRGRVDAPGGGTLLRGDLLIDIGRLQTTIYGNTQVADLSAFVEIRTNANLFSDPNPSLRVHAVFAADGAVLSDPSLSAVLDQLLGAPVRIVGATVVIGHEVVLGVERDGVFGTIRRLPTHLRAAGIETPDWIEDFIDEIDWFIDRAEDIERYVFSVVDISWDTVMNGIDGFRFGGVEVCDPTGITGVCVEIVPSFTFPGIPGICDEVFPASQFPGLRNSSGDCDSRRFASAVVFPLLERAIEEATGLDDVDISELVARIGARLTNGASPIHLTCAEAMIELSAQNQETALSLVGEVLGLPFGFTIDVNLLTIHEDLAGLLPDFIAQLFNPTVTGCAGPDPSLFEVNGAGVLPTDTTIPFGVARPAPVNEGTPATLSGVVRGSAYGLGGVHTLTVDWGDGTVDYHIVTTTGTADAPFSLTHVYADDGNGGTAMMPITVNDQAVMPMLGAGPIVLSGEAATGVIVRNVAPTIVGTLPSTGREASEVRIPLRVRDLGRDGVTLFVDWGDGTRQELTAAPDGSRVAQEHKFTLTHTYGNLPAGVANVSYPISVQAIDDDGANAYVRRTIVVENAPPEWIGGNPPVRTSAPRGQWRMQFSEGAAMVLCGVREAHNAAVEYVPEPPAFEELTLCGFTDRDGWADVSYDSGLADDFDRWAFRYFYFQAVDMGGVIGPMTMRGIEFPMYAAWPPFLREGPPEFVGTDTVTAKWVQVYTSDGIRCRLDGANHPCSWHQSQSNHTLTGLGDGPHRFEAASVTQGGKVSEYAGWSFVVDTTPPVLSWVSTPSDGVSRSQFYVRADDVTPVTYECRLDGGAWEPCEYVHGVTSPQAREYFFEMRGTDVLGHVSEPLGWRWQGAVPVSFEFDQYPQPLTAETSALFHWSAAGTNLPAEYFYRCRVFRDGGYGGWEVCAPPFQLDGLTDGQYAVEVELRDGRVDDFDNSVRWRSIGRSWYVDTLPGGPVTPPNTRITSAPGLGAQASFDGTATFEFVGVGPDVAGFRCHVRPTGTGSSMSVNELVTECSSPYTVTGLAEGHFVFGVSAYDSQGRIDGTPDRETFQVNLTPTRRVWFTDGPVELTKERTVTLAWESNYPDTVYRCSSRFGTPFDCESPYVYPSVDPNFEGTRELEFTVWAYPPDSEFYSQIVSRVWTIDTTIDDADTLITWGPPPLSASAEATFWFESDVPWAVFQCRLNAGQWQPCESPHTVTNLANGQRSFAVRAVLVDDDGTNIDQSPATHTWTVDWTAPRTTFVLGPPPVSPAAVAYFYVTADEDVHRLECRLDGAEWRPCEPMHRISGISSGAHVYEARAIDHAGNVGVPAVWKWRTNVVEPTTEITRAPIGTSGPVVVIELRSDDPDARFECRVGDGDWETCDWSWSPAPLPGGPVTVYARAVNLAGARDQTPASHSFTVDDTLPTVTILSSPSGPDQQPFSVTFSVDKPGAAVWCRLGGAAATRCTSPLALPVLDPGEHALEVYAVDTLGNRGGSAVVAIDVPFSTEVTALVTSAPSGVVSAADASVAFTSNAPGATFECRLDGGAGEPCVSPLALSGLADGPHTVDVEAIDAFGDRSAPVTANWSVDTTAPVVTITAGPPPVVESPPASPAARFEFTADDVAATFTCQLDRGAVAPCASPFDLAGLDGLTAGSHELRVFATDPPGNRGGPATWSWNIVVPDAPTTTTTTTSTTAPPDDGSTTTTSTSTTSTTVPDGGSTTTTSTTTTTVPDGGSTTTTSTTTTTVPDGGSTTTTSTTTTTVPDDGSTTTTSTPPPDDGSSTPPDSSTSTTTPPAPEPVCEEPSTTAAPATTTAPAPVTDPETGQPVDGVTEPPDAPPTSPASTPEPACSIPPTAPPTAPATTQPPATQPPSGGGGGGTGGGSGGGTGGGGGSPTSAVVSPPRVVSETGVTVFAPGDPASFVGSGFVPAEVVTGTFHSDPISMGTQVADVNGRVLFRLVLPADIELGAHRVELVGEVSGLVELAVTIGDVETVTAALPTTGAATSEAVLIGALLLASGVAVLLLLPPGRRTASDRHHGGT